MPKPASRLTCYVERSRHNRAVSASRHIRGGSDTGYRASVRLRALWREELSQRRAGWHDRHCHRSPALGQPTIAAQFSSRKRKLDFKLAVTIKQRNQFLSMSSHSLDVLLWRKTENASRSLISGVDVTHCQERALHCYLNQSVANDIETASPGLIRHFGTRPCGGADAVEVVECNCLIAACDPFIHIYMIIMIFRSKREYFGRVYQWHANQFAILGAKLTRLIYMIHYP